MMLANWFLTWVYSLSCQLKASGLKIRLVLLVFRCVPNWSRTIALALTVSMLSKLSLKWN